RRAHDRSTARKDPKDLHAVPHRAYRQAHDRGQLRPVGPHGRDPCPARAGGAGQFHGEKSVSGGDPDGVRQQAVAWLMRFHEGPIDLEEELELELWLEAHPANREVLAGMVRAWRMAGEAAEAP